MKIAQVSHKSRSTQLLQLQPHGNGKASAATANCLRGRLCQGAWYGGGVLALTKAGN